MRVRVPERLRRARLRWNSFAYAVGRPVFCVGPHFGLASARRNNRSPQMTPSFVRRRHNRYRPYKRAARVQSRFGGPIKRGLLLVVELDGLLIRAVDSFAQSGPAKVALMHRTATTMTSGNHKDLLALGSVTVHNETGAWVDVAVSGAAGPGENAIRHARRRKRARVDVGEH